MTLHYLQAIHFLSLSLTLNIVDLWIQLSVSAQHFPISFLLLLLLNSLILSILVACQLDFLCASRDGQFRIILISISHSHTFLVLMNIFCAFNENRKSFFLFLGIFFFLFKPLNSWGFCNPFSFSFTLVVREPHTHFDSGDSKIFGVTSE